MFQTDRPLVTERVQSIDPNTIAVTIIQPEDRDLIMQLSPLYLEQIQAAKQEGEQRGKTLGEEQKQQKIALKMLEENIPLDTIERVTGLTADRLHSLRPL